MRAPDLIRAPNHLGDLVMALPALAAAGGADVLVVRWLAPLVDLALAGGGRMQGRKVIPLDRGGRGWIRAVGAVRAGRYRRGVLLPPSFSSALILYAGGVSQRRGSATDRRSPLLTEAVPPPALTGLHRAAAYLRLVTGDAADEAPVPRLPVPPELHARFQAAAPPAEGPRIGLFPGSHAPSRRWDPDRFAELARRLAAGGATVLVFGAPAEKPLTAAVAGDVALDLGGRTDLPLLAAGLAACDLLVTNDSGPMHLAAAVGTRTVSLWGAGDPRVTGPLGAGQTLVRRPDLPCVPCVKNVCPRRGAGYLLPDASRECLRLLRVADVEAEVRRQLTRTGA